MHRIVSRALGSPLSPPAAQYRFRTSIKWQLPRTACKAASDITGGTPSDSTTRRRRKTSRPTTDSAASSNAGTAPTIEPEQSDAPAPSTKPAKPRARRAPRTTNTTSTSSTPATDPPPPPALPTQTAPKGATVTRQPIAPPKTNGTLLVVDGTYLSCRAYFGYAGRGMGLATRTGVPTSITYSVIKTLHAAVADVRPTALAVVFDAGFTWRSVMSLVDPTAAPAAARLAAEGRLDWEALAARLLQLTAQGCSLQREAPPPPPEMQPRLEGSEDEDGEEGPTFTVGNGNGSRSRQFNLVAAQAVLAEALGPELAAALSLVSEDDPSKELDELRAAAAAAAGAGPQAAAVAAAAREEQERRLLEALAMGADPELLQQVAVQPGALAAAPTYKAGRTSFGREFYEDYYNCQRILGVLGIPPLQCPGIEADDLAGLLTREAVQAGMSVRLMSGDRDLMQLVDDRTDVRMLYVRSGGAAAAFAARRRGNGGVPYDDMGEGEVLGELGVWPAQLAEYRALTGDTSDKLPGVAGIGPKTAVQLLQQYDGLDGVRQAVAAAAAATGAGGKKGSAGGGMTPKRVALLQESWPMANYTLAMARVLGAAGAPPCPPGLLPPDLLPSLALRGLDANPQAALAALEELELHSLARNLRKMHQDFGGV